MAKGWGIWMGGWVPPWVAHQLATSAGEEEEGEEVKEVEEEEEEVRTIFR